MFTLRSLQITTELRTVYIHKIKYGLPDTLVADNVPQFRSDQLVDFSEEYCIKLPFTILLIQGQNFRFPRNSQWKS